MCARAWVPGGPARVAGLRGRACVKPLLRHKGRLPGMAAGRIVCLWAVLSRRAAGPARAGRRPVRSSFLGAAQPLADVRARRAGHRARSAADQRKLAAAADQVRANGRIVLACILLRPDTSVCGNLPNKRPDSSAAQRQS